MEKNKSLAASEIGEAAESTVYNVFVWAAAWKQQQQQQKNKKKKKKKQTKTNKQKKKQKNNNNKMTCVPSED